MGVDARRALPLSARGDLCEHEGCECTPGSRALGLWALFGGNPFLCLGGHACANFGDATVHKGSQRLGLWASTRDEPFLCLSVETLPAPDGRVWDHSVPFAHGSKPHLMYCPGWVLVGPCCACCAKGPRHATAASVSGTMLRRESSPHYRDTNF